MPSTRATRGSRRTSTRPRRRTRSPSRWARSSPSSTRTTPPTSHGLRGCCRARRPRPRPPSESTPPPTRRRCLQRSSPSTRTGSTSACGPRARAAPSRRSGSGCARARRRAKRRSPSSRSCSRRRMRGSRAGSDEAAASGAFWPALLLPLPSGEKEGVQDTRSRAYRTRLGDARVWPSSADAGTVKGISEPYTVAGLSRVPA
mmetsp:Transcript_36675/g.118306  ORF Transcript_36675/g.118306 Transcript_36675/m.118306 type:complete len:202 (+) Transcript_36675:334-939(+)